MRVTFGNARGRVLATLCAVAAVALLAAGCGSSESSGGSGGSGTSASGDSGSGGDGSLQGKHVALVSCGDANPWCKVYNHTLIDGLRAQGVKVDYLTDDFDPSVQVQNLNSAIGSRPDLIVIEATDANSVVPSFRRAQQAGVPVFSVDGPAAPAAEEFLTSQLLTDSEALGRYAAQNLVEGIERQGRRGGKIIALTGTEAALNTQARMRAFREELAKHPGYDLVEVQDTNWDQVKAAKLAQQIFAKYGKTGIAGAYGMADYLAAGIIQAAEQAGVPLGVDKRDGLIVTGSNCFRVGIDNIQAGKQYGTGTQAPGAEGRFALGHIEEFLKTGEIDRSITNREDRITVDNVDRFVEACTLA
jgi:ribose transport system substrate-binding protein